jgi:hypothetical protein
VAAVAAVAVAAVHGSRSQPGIARRAQTGPKVTAWFVLSLRLVAQMSPRRAPLPTLVDPLL